MSTQQPDDGNPFGSHSFIHCYGEEVVKTHIGCVRYQREPGQSPVFPLLPPVQMPERISSIPWTSCQAVSEKVHPPRLRGTKQIHLQNNSLHNPRSSWVTQAIQMHNLLSNWVTPAIRLLYPIYNREKQLVNQQSL